MEDDAEFMLSSLGVTSANPEDIERNLLSQAVNNGGKRIEAEGNEDGDSPERLNRGDCASTNEAKLYSKLRALEFEIDAVASTVKPEKEAASENGDGLARMEEDGSQDSGSEPDVRQALAADRLRSLKKTKALIEKELKAVSKGKSSYEADHAELISNIVKEEKARPKRKAAKKVEKTGKGTAKRHKTVSFDDDADFDAVLDAASSGFVETERDELVRKGILTPFHKLKGFERRFEEPGPSQRHSISTEESTQDDFASRTVAKALKSMAAAAQARPTTKLLASEALPKLDAPTFPFHRLKTPIKTHRSSEMGAEKRQKAKRKTRRPLPDERWRKRIAREDIHSGESEGIQESLSCGEEEEEQADTEDEVEDGPTDYVVLEGGLKIPERIFGQLFDYQKVCVQWLWELHCQKAGGIIGDEMGLGKTIQVLAFLGALHSSGMYRPSIIVCPVTLLRQWKREAQKWYPSFKVDILHDSARDLDKRKKRSKSSESDYGSEDSMDRDTDKKLLSKSQKWDSLINRVLGSESGLLITTYEQLRILGDKLLEIEWGYAVLDEGHRIRNPNAEVTLICKQLQTVHRVIMTGAPIQNKLSELWSLFDFVFPGKLGVLPVFEAEFAVPISVGGYANASPLQVSTAYRCAVVLRDLIMPYLLRRMKADVNAHLPKKTEHVLFCSLTTEQRSVYRAFLASSEVEQIFDGNKNSLFGIDVMRKICNHPDLLEREHADANPDYGNVKRSGKMQVVEQVLKVWEEQGHRVLLFTQTQQMLDIIETFLIDRGYTYRRMDGLTPVKHRMALIDEFNDSADVFIFILTTKVGGLGTNLTGANRVVIFDPDWNPSTDMQARERAWRIGQKRDVTVYRLITRGTIEEKVYHRQIYKHFLTNKILKNPQQKRFFKARDMKDLFTLNDDGEPGATETSNIFGQLSEAINVISQSNDREDMRKPNGDFSNKGDNSTSTDPSRRRGKEKVEPGDDEIDEETNILKSLFDARGIHSAVNHDVIMNAHDGEKIRLDEEASRVAQRAAEALRLSRMLRSRENVSVPTWTGRSGMAGAPSSVLRKFGSTLNPKLTTTSKPSESFSRNGSGNINGISAGASAGKALSSAELLARVRGNQENAVGAGIDHPIGSVCKSGRVQPEVLARQICTFLQQRGGSSDSSSIVGHFRSRTPAEDLPLFKNLLKEIATLEKNPTGSIWLLKQDYQ